MGRRSVLRSVGSASGSRMPRAHSPTEDHHDHRDRLQRTRPLPHRRASRRAHRRPAQRRPATGRPRRATDSATRSTASRPASRAGSATGSRSGCRRSRPCATRCPRATADAARCAPRPTQPDGAVRVTASLYDPPNRDGGPLNWSRNWASLAVLPPARDAGRLYYRFRVSSRLVLDGQASMSLVSTSVNFGIVADAAKSSPFEPPASRPRSSARSWACRPARTRTPRRRRCSRARSPCARATPRRWRSSSAPTCCSTTAGCACTKARAPGSAPTEPGASGIDRVPLRACRDAAAPGPPRRTARRRRR